VGKVKKSKNEGVTTVGNLKKRIFKASQRWETKKNGFSRRRNGGKPEKRESEGVTTVGNLKKRNLMASQLLRKQKKMAVFVISLQSPGFIRTPKRPVRDNRFFSGKKL
jgi:hypothetical protein